MREIKFRAWDTKEKTMIKDIWIVPECNWGVYSDNDALLISNENVVLMQYTGLKDKNGVEIYEGDILKMHEYIDCVIWRDDLCGFSFKGDKGRMNLVDWLEHGQYSDPEVIGNIYENPELLTGDDI